jgi:hypothetical protein
VILTSCLSPVYSAEPHNIVDSINDFGDQVFATEYLFENVNGDSFVLGIGCTDKKFDVLYMTTREAFAKKTLSVRFSPGSWITNWKFTYTGMQYDYYVYRLTNPSNFYKKLLTSKKVALSMDSIQGGPHRSYFDVDGFSNYINSFKKLGCKI